MDDKQTSPKAGQCPMTLQKASENEGKKPYTTEDDLQDTIKQTAGYDASTETDLVDWFAWLVGLIICIEHLEGNNEIDTVDDSTDKAVNNDNKREMTNE